MLTSEEGQSSETIEIYAWLLVIPKLVKQSIICTPLTKTGGQIL